MSTQPPASSPSGHGGDQPYADRVYRSGGALAGGVLMLGVTVWLGGDAVLRGDGRVPVVSLGALLVAVPLIVAMSLRPAVFAGERRIRIRNPFRTVVAPWGAVETVRARYSTELVAQGRTYQMWSIPVSLRARSKAHRHNQRLASGEGPRRGLFGVSTPSPDDYEERTAPADVAVRELRELAERHREEPGAQGEVTTRWSWETLAPMAAGTVLLIVLWLTA
ncbi:PH domain-containing protein [Streptomyces sp. YIM 98790]|uniref:PH domain-containing protein n=1 Tax=Streptomyces sp. YIM 98790 TaxID=2689077 RepID=UPI00140CEFFB|nr:PH domain-containing protein [Streptomyces sp. YIM 98790]